MHYYGNGGPGPHTKQLRVDAPDGCTDEEWLRAAAFRWEPGPGWFPESNAQLDIRCLGEFFLIDESEVLDFQAQMLARSERTAPTMTFEAVFGGKVKQFTTATSGDGLG